MKIDAEKETIAEVFSKYFEIPNYQRQYVWSKDEVIKLLENIYDAFNIFNESNFKTNYEYFLGNYVIQTTKDTKQQDVAILLDGQQRITTLLLIFACFRDLLNEKESKEEHDNDDIADSPNCNNFLFS